MKQTLDLLFFGDIVGRPGRRVVKWYLSSLRNVGKLPDVVIGNVENTTHGFGLNEKHYYELLDSGFHILTSGNHIWDRKEIFNYIYSANRLLRPANFPAQSAGTGAGVFEFPGFKIAAVNLIGQVFMGNYNSPWEKLESLVPQLLYETPIIFVDFHAEATAEKVAFAYFASSLGVSVFTGTHTHVQTADEKILNNKTGFITDTGFCGSYNSVIGMVPESSIERLKLLYPARLDIMESTVVQLNASRFTIDIKTGDCLGIHRINQVVNLEETGFRFDDSEDR